MSTTDDLMALVWALVRSGPNFDGRDKKLRAAIESALQAEYERGRSDGWQVVAELRRHLVAGATISSMGGPCLERQEDGSLIGGLRVAYPQKCAYGIGDE